MKQLLCYVLLLTIIATLSGCAITDGAENIRENKRKTEDTMVNGD